MRDTQAYSGAIISFLAGVVVLFLTPSRSNATPQFRFRKVSGNLVVVPILVNGRGPFDFLIDTGANTTLLDLNLPAELDLKPVGRSLLQTLTGPTWVPRFSLGSVTVGQKSDFGLTALALEMSQIHSVDRRIRGVLGLDFLIEFAFLLDYGHQQLALYDPFETPDLARGTRLPIRLASGRILIDTRTDESVNGSWSLALDSGIPTVAIFANRMRELKDSRASCNREIQVTSYVSSIAAKTVTLPDLTLANLRLRDVPVVLLPPNPELQHGIEDGLIPAAFFRRILVNARQSYAMFDVDGSLMRDVGCRTREIRQSSTAHVFPGGQR